MEKSQSKKPQEKVQEQKVKQVRVTQKQLNQCNDEFPTLINPIFIKQNHLSSSHQKLLKYEQRNYEIQYLSNLTSVDQQQIKKNYLNQPFEPSSQKGQQIFQKYGSLIQNQPFFLRQIIMKRYLPCLPSKFQNQFTQILFAGSAFEVLWWGSALFVLFQAYKRRNIEVQMKQRVLKGLGISFAFFASTLVFHQNIYEPLLKDCFFKNIKYIDSMMQKHVKILKNYGFDVDSPPEQEKSIENANSQKIEIKKQQNKEKTKTQTEVLNKK